MLRVKNMTVQFGEYRIVDDVSFELLENQWLMLVGPNGAGKSTIINAISNGVPCTGEILLQGKNLRSMRAAEIARNIGVMTQSHSVSYAFSVREIVKLGRYAYSTGLLSTTAAEDDERIEQALRDTGMLDYADQNVLTLSGGELQRTFLAQIFAQNPRLLILDEPSNHLDLVYQKQVFDLIEEWVRQPGRAVMSVVHDLSLVRAYGTHTLLLHKGRKMSEGPTREVLNRNALLPVYEMDVFDWMNRMYAQWQE